MTGVIGANGNGTRMQYRVNTEGGSSGAPCFNTEWQLVALHHSGDPNFEVDHKPTYNEGIPVGAILKLLAERGKQSQLG
jgi:V8-like Glu-specific endopeptidase